MSRTRIFAYGSNMHPERMHGRVPAAAPLGRACLRGWRLLINKRGRDGSAKANLAEDPAGEVWGVLWELTIEELRDLDEHEGGYERVRISVHRDVQGEAASLEAEAYVSRRLHDDTVPYDWYLAHLVAGARAFGLPEEYVAWLESLPSRDREGGEDGEG